jgi:type IV secretory pathway component VirB8
MKTLVFLAILVALAIVWYLLPKTKETFVPEFLDQTGVEKTARTASSSHAQQTNHLINPLSIPQPIPGVETPFRVNMYSSHMV